MPLTADPTVTYNTQGNVLSAATITNGTPNAGNIADFSNANLGGWVSVNCTPGTASATNGIQVQVFPAGDNTPHYDTVAIDTFTIAQTTSTVAQQSRFYPSGKYSITITNLDATHTVAVSITASPIA